MKKTIVILLLLVTNFLFGNMNKEIEKKVKLRIIEMMDGHLERENELERQKNAHKAIEKISETTTLSYNEFLILREGLEKLYPYDYIGQLKRMRDLVKTYEETKKSLVTQEVEKIEKIKTENLEAKKIIETQKEELKIPKNLYLKLKVAAEKRYPKNYIEQKKYLEHAVEIYGILN